MTTTTPDRNLPASRRHLAPWLVATALLTGAAAAQTQRVAPAPAVQTLTKERVAALAQAAFTAFAPKGLALAVVQDGELLGEWGFGDRGDGSPVTPHTVFNIASCSKAFTAAITAQLVGEGKLDWNDRVTAHVPEFRMADPWITSQMTIADLLSHRCGLVTFAGDLLWYGSDYDDAQVLAHIDRLPIKQRFREQFGYQNLMYMVAGMVAARTTGRSWEDLVEERIMRPLGMTESRASVQRLPAGAEIALPHIDGVRVEDHVFVACKPAAAIYSSVHDLSAWIRLLVAGGSNGEAKVLDAGALAEMWRPHVAMGGGSGAAPDDFRAYGMGWFLSLDRGAKLVEHDGGMPGFLSKVSLLPKHRFGFVVLNNANDGVVNEAIKGALLAEHAGEDGEAVIARLAKIGERIKARAQAAIRVREGKRIAGTQPRLPLAQYAGRYEDASYGPAEVRVDGDHLVVELLPSKRRLHGSMSHWHQDVFRVDFPDRFLPFALFSFSFDSDGAVAGFTIDCPIADFDFGALDFRRARESR